MISFGLMERLPTNSGYEIVKTNKRDGYYYACGEFEYIPPGWVKVGRLWYPLGYRVTTMDNKSLGLAGNTNILTYKLNEWVGIPKRELDHSIRSEGGIWTTINLSDARTLQRYFLTRFNYVTNTRIYLAAIGNPVFANSYRVKSEKIMLLEELT